MTSNKYQVTSIKGVIAGFFTLLLATCYLLLAQAALAQPTPTPPRRIVCDCIITYQVRGAEPTVLPAVQMEGDSVSSIDGGECQETRGRSMDVLIAGGVDVVDSSQEVTNCHDLADEPDALITPAAPTPRTPSEFGYQNPLGTTNLRVIINRVIRAALGFVGALFLVMFIYGGILWMTAGGEEKKVQSAKTALKNAVIGMLVISFSYLIISFIFETAAVIRG